jgi:hypothetical protein
MIAAVAPTKVIERQVKRFVAVCPFVDLDLGTEDLCAFERRKGPTLHPTADSAVVESIRHLRELHRTRLSRGVTATRRRQVVDETVELA